jgi:hypothetical protein
VAADLMAFLAGTKARDTFQQNGLVFDLVESIWLIWNYNGNGWSF